MDINEAKRRATQIRRLYSVREALSVRIEGLKLKLKEDIESNMGITLSDLFFDLSFNIDDLSDIFGIPRSKIYLYVEPLVKEACCWRCRRTEVVEIKTRTDLRRYTDSYTCMNCADIEYYESGGYVFGLSEE